MSFRPLQRLFIFILLLVLSCWKLTAGIPIELDVVFNDTTRQYQSFYILGGQTSDTLAVSDSLSFRGTERISLFYNIPDAQKIKLKAVDRDGNSVESPYFKISSWRTTFWVVVYNEHIDISVEDYLYPQKSESELPYFYFLLIFFVVKTIIAGIYIFVSKVPKSMLLVISGTFLLSSFIYWFVPFDYWIRLCIIFLVEFLLVLYAGQKKIALFNAAWMILIVNLIGFGIISFACLLLVFW